MEDPAVIDVLIVGAGPSGLTAAYHLLKQSSLKVHILEADPTYVGGLSRTEEHKGYLLDIGGHRFFSKSTEIENLWQEILPHDMLVRPRLSRIFYKRHFYHYPLRAFQALKNLGVGQSILCVLSYIKARLFPLAPVRSFKDWVSNRFGARLFSIFFKSYTEKVWGISCDDLSADWAAQRIHGLSLFRAVISSFGAHFKFLKIGQADNKVIKTLIERFHYPRKGPGMMWAAARDKIAACGGSIDMGVKATEFEWRAAEKYWLVTGTDMCGTRRAFKAKHVISSAPLGQSIPAIRPLPRVAERIKGLRYRDFVLVALKTNKAPSFPDNWIYVHDPDLKVGRIQNFAAWSPEMVPTIGGGCLGMEYFCQESDAFWNMSDSDLIALASKELVYLGLAYGDEIEGGHVIRQPKAYPVYDDAYSGILAELKEELAASYPTFHPVGRNGMHRYNNQDHAMMTGLLTARNILEGTPIYDVWNVNADAEYHEEGKIT